MELLLENNHYLLDLFLKQWYCIIMAAVYIACRETENPRPLYDIATIANVPAVDPSKCMIKLANMINANEKAKCLAQIRIEIS